MYKVLALSSAVSRVIKTWWIIFFAIHFGKPLKAANLLMHLTFSFFIGSGDQITDPTGFVIRPCVTFILYNDTHMAQFELNFYIKQVPDS